MNKEYKFQKRIPGSLAIGDDEGGSALVYMRGEKGCGLYKVDFSVIEAEEAEFIAPTLKDFLIKGIGLNAL